MSDLAHTLLIGADGGGTGCRVAIGTVTDGILATAQGGRANAASDPDLAVKNIIATAKAAAANAGLPEDLLKDATAHLGLAGIMTKEDGARLASALPYKDNVVTDDRPTAVSGALGEQDCFLLSVGTGTIAAAKSDGQIKTVGGWGFHVADQASGAWLGRAGLERMLLCYDGLAEHTDLTHALFAKFGDDPNAVTSFSMSAKPGDYGTFARDIVAGASAQDPWGIEIMTSGAHHLLQCLEALGFQPGQALCLSGGVGPHYADFMPPEVLSGRIDCQGSALDGAFQLAKSAILKSAGSGS